MLYDRLLRNPIHPPYWLKGVELDDWRQVLNDIKPYFDQVEVFNIDNVSDYFFEGTNQDYWDFNDFPNVAPPFEYMWFESKAPKNIRTEKSITKVNMPNITTGILVLSKRSDMRSLTRLDFISGLEENLKSFVRSENRGLVSEEFLGKSNELRERIRLLQSMTEEQYNEVSKDIFVGANASMWSSQYFCFQEADKNIIGPLGVVNLSVDGLGKVSKYNIGCFGEPNVPDMRDFIDKTKSFYNPTFLALSFLHCKNVIVNIHKSPPLSKILVKKGIKPFCDYHVLNIEPMKKIIQHTEGSEGVGTKKALHICRGHFADYTKGNGLFGKYKDVFWKESHVRGSIHEGIVDKDYAIKAEVK